MAKRKDAELTVRPGELMCLVCRLGACRGTALRDKRLKAILDAARKRPRTPVRLLCYDELGDDVDALLSDKDSHVEILKDRELLKKIMFDRHNRPIANGPVPLAKILMRVVETVENPDGLCHYEATRSEGWKPCPHTKSGDYARGRAKARKLLRSFLPEYYHSDSEFKRLKRESVRDAYKARGLRIYPSHLLYIVAHYGIDLEVGHDRPLAVDNMMEMGVAMRRNPEIPVTVVDRDCMLCPPCPSYDKPTGLCDIHCQNPPPKEYFGENQLRLLRDWGLRLRDTLPAAKLMRRLFDTPTDQLDWYWYSIGSPASKWGYVRGKAAGLGFLDAYEDLEGAVARVEKLIADKGVRALVPEEETRLVERVLRKTRGVLGKGDRKAAYDAFVNDDERFYMCWKGYLEQAAAGLARFPKSVKKERRERNGLPVLTARRAARPVRCDGKLNESAWKRSAFSAGFLTMVERAAVAETGVQALHDRENLYFGLLCAERDTGRLRAEARIGTEIVPTDKRSRRWLRMDDALLICVQPDEAVPEYFQFMLNSRGVKLGERVRVVDGQPQSDYVRETDWHAASHVGKNLWSAEVVIPFRCLDRRGKGASKWRVNFHRLFGQDRLCPASWSYSVRTWHALDRFGRLVFSVR